MHNPFLTFTIQTIIVIALIFGLHISVLYFLNLEPLENMIIPSYIINTALVIIVFGVLYIFRNKFKSQLGFFFMAGSFLKFAIFFIIFNPHYNQDNNITKLEFFAFFVPYVVGLILETYSLSKWLNKLD